MVCPAFHSQSFIWIFLMTTDERKSTGLQCEWHEVTHIISNMCVDLQSTVLIPCKYSYPRHERVHAVQWSYRRKAPEESVGDVFQDRAFEGRVEFVGFAGDGEGNCSLLLRDVRDSDAGIFYFALTTDETRTSSRGIGLEITDADVEVISQYDVVTEGDWLVLFCGSCVPSIIVPTYIWKKDGHVYSQIYGSNQLDLNSVKPENGGRYSCTLSGHEGLNSSSGTVSVRPGYPPKNMSVSISGSGDSVNLICSCDAKPPVHEFSWFKENESESVGSGQTFNITNNNFSHTGGFYCVAQNQYGSERSAAVSLTVTEGRMSPVVTLAVIAAVVITSVFLIVAFGVCIRRKRGTSEVQNSTGLQQHRKIEAPEDTYITLDPKSMSSDYDTLDSVRRSGENGEHI